MSHSSAFLLRSSSISIYCFPNTNSSIQFPSMVVSPLFHLPSNSSINSSPINPSPRSAILGDSSPSSSRRDISLPEIALGAVQQRVARAAAILGGVEQRLARAARGEALFETAYEP